MKRFLTLVVAAFAFASGAVSQTASTLVSPEVHADRRVTFRIAAPKAADVTFKGDWHDDAKKMEKGADGAWSLTLGPLAPSTYIYAFTVDGVAIADPVNPRIKLRARTSASLVEVPALTTPPSLQEARDVPHGAVEINWHRATALDGETRSFSVYTPPGYAEETTRRYPVLYLLHGNNDRPAGWLDVGNLNFLADNLIAEKKMTPMIIVMPYGHALPFGQRGQAPRTNTTVFAEYLLKDVIPLAEGKYRIDATRERRAVAGFSMGGGQALHVFFSRLDRFSSGGAFASSFPGLEAEHAALLAESKATNAKIDLLWIGCGRQDSAFAGAERIVGLLASKKIDHTWLPTEGVHNYAFLRNQLEAFLPKLFRPGKNP